MANVEKHQPMLQFLFFFLVLFSAAILVQEATGSRANAALRSHHFSSPERELNLQNNSGRLLIGSVAPTCTYNECRGCKYRCRAEQVPVEGNDPINSAYHYKCVCHR